MEIWRNSISSITQQLLVFDSGRRALSCFLQHCACSRRLGRSPSEGIHSWSAWELWTKLDLKLYSLLTSACSMFEVAQNEDEEENGL